MGLSPNIVYKDSDFFIQHTLVKRHAKPQIRLLNIKASSSKLKQRNLRLIIFNIKTRDKGTAIARRNSGCIGWTIFQISAKGANKVPLINRITKHRNNSVRMNSSTRGHSQSYSQIDWRTSACSPFVHRTLKWRRKTTDRRDDRH
jgi:hypothetical protein